MNLITRKSIVWMFALAVLATAITGCKHPLENEGVVLARAGNHYLYEDDIRGLVAPGTSPHDSIVLVKNYIRKWIETQLLVDQALKNLPEEKLDFSKQLEDYHNSLIIYKYETELVNQKLDTTVSSAKIKEYYDSHKNDFQLKENIVKVVYAVFRNEEEEIDEAKYLKKMFKKLPDSALVDSLESLSERWDFVYSTDTSHWLPFDKLIEMFPIETYNQELYLKNHRFVEITDEKNIFLVKFVNFKIKDETSPLDFERRYIRSIILNKRKKRLIKQMHRDILDKGLKENNYEVY